jgi:hypothetical protein
VMCVCVCDVCLCVCKSCNSENVWGSLWDVSQFIKL